MTGFLQYNPTAHTDEDTDARRLLIEILPRKDELYTDELILVDRLETTYRRLTRWEARRIYQIHGRLPKVKE